jgi:hypothetical protein
VLHRPESNPRGALAVDATRHLNMTTNGDHGGNQGCPARLAAAAGEVSLRAATADEALELTGYSIGRIPPFGHRGEVKTLIGRDLCVYPWVWAAAGSSAAVFRVAPRTLRALSNAVVAPWRRSLGCRAGPPKSGRHFGWESARARRAHRPGGCEKPAG